MVAAISGSGLGLFGSSASVLGGVHGNASLGRGTDRLYINSATGNLVVQSVDESLAALGLDISLVRTYNSQGLMDDDNGDNWRLGIHQRLHSWTGTVNTVGSTVTKVFGDGREVVYRYDAGLQAHVSAEGDGAHDTISHSGAQWTWTDGSSRIAETYDSNGRLQATVDADGNDVTYIYTGQLLTRIDDSSGQQTFLDYVGNDLAAIRVVSNGQTQTLTRYFYDSLHRLRQVVVDLTPSDNAAALVDLNSDGIFETVDDETYATTYTYDGQSKRIASLRQSDGTYVAFTYEEVEGNYRVKTYATSAEGASGVGTSAQRVTTLSYSGAGMTAEESMLSTTDVATTTTNYALNPIQFPPSWSTPGLLESSPLHAVDPQVVFDALGNGLAVWAQGTDVFARRYTAGTNSWGPLITLDTSSNEASAPTLSIDRETGDAIVAWGEHDGVTSRLAMSRFTASSSSWSAATQLASWEGAALASTHLSVSVSGHYAAVSWAQGTTSNRELFQIIYKRGVSSGAEILEYSGEPVDQVQVQIDSSGNALTVWRQSDLASERIYFNRWRDATQAYSGPTLLDTNGDGGQGAILKFDAQGNAFALWGQWDGLQLRRFDAATNAWGPASAVQTTDGDVWNWELAVDEQGNALVAWLAGEWESPTVHARRFDPATGEWGTTASLNNSAGVSLDDAFSVSISGSNAVVAWVQDNGAGQNDVYAARLSGGSWSTPQLLDTRTEGPDSVHAAVDANGRVSVLWRQPDGGARSVYEARFDNSGRAYTVPSGATWQSIANTLYNVNSVAAGEALRVALGNPTLTTGAQLTNLPPTLSVSVTQSTTVPAYYTVQSGDTWTSITEAIYGTTDPFVVEELQELLDNPLLAPGMHLTVPLVLNSTRTHVRDALGNVTTYIKDSAGRLFAVLAPEVDGRRQSTYYDYDHDGNVTVITEDPADLNRTTSFEYDERGNLLKTRDAAGTTITRTYNAHNQVLSETRYRDVDPDGFGPSYPVDGLTTRYVYDSENHLRFTISAAGRVTEHRYNAAGQRVATLTYPVEGYFEATASEGDLESFVWYQPNRERTDYTYDFRGNVETASVWPETDWEGAGVGIPSVTRFVYDQRGQLLQTIQPRGELTSDVGDYATTFTYDGLGRLLTTTQWVWNGEARTTLNDYDDADNRTVTTLENGDNTLVTTSLYNGVGELISVIASTGQGAPLGQTTYTYDAAGRLRITTDPVGVRTFVVYDRAGRRVGTVDGDGTLTEFAYSPAGELIKTIQYGDRLGSAAIAALMNGGEPADDFDIDDLRDSLEDVPGRNSFKDRVIRSVFDAAGKLAFTIDEIGAVVGYTYDGAGRVIEQVQYVNVFQVPRHWGTLKPQDVEVVVNPSHDRRQRNFYDKDDRLRATLDAAGYLVEYKYDVGGRLIEQVAYATPTDPLMRESGSLDDLRPALDDTSPTRDIRSRFFYDGRGRRVGVLDGEGYLTETYYGNSSANLDLVSQVIRYDRPLVYQEGDSLEALKSQVLYTDSWRQTQYRYNGAGDVVKETVQAGTESAHSSTSTEFEYDLAGRMVRTTRGYDSPDTRTTRVRYDALGRVTQELTAEGSARIAEGLPVETAWAQYSVTHAYDQAGRRISATDQYGNRTVFYYDDDGRLAYTVNATGEVQHSKYDALGRLTDTIAYDRRISTAGLDGGRVTSQITSLIFASPARDSHTSVSYEYVEGGEWVTTTTAEGASTKVMTGVFGDLIGREEIRAGASRGEKYIYDQRGLLTQTHWDPNGIHRFEVREYDAFGRVVAVTDQYNNTARTEYDALGRILATVDPTNARRSTTYDAFSRTVSVTGATPGSTVSFAYDDALRTMTLTTAQGVKVTTEYSLHGETVKVITTDTEGTPPTEVSYEYDVNGQLLRVHDEEGDRTVSEYDRAGRLYRSIDGNGSITEYQYDGANRVLSTIAGVGTLNLTTTYAHYDIETQQRLLRTTQPNGIVTETRYDRDGRLSTVTVNPNGADQTVTRYQYDDVNNTTTVIQGDGMPEQRVTRHEFDALGRRIAEIVDPGTGTNPATGRAYLNLATQYRYDDNGNLTRKIDAEGHSTWYVYDNDDRLTFTIDALGGITETTYDLDDRVVGIRRFATATTAVAGWVNVDMVTTGNFTVQRDNADDRYEQTLYDLDGRAVFKVDPMGGVTHRTFDPNGNVTREVFYNATVPLITYPDTGGLEDAVADALGVADFSLVTPGAEDRVRYTTYDARNRPVYSVDASGAVIKNEYDAADNVTRVTAFARRFIGDATDVSQLVTFEATPDTRNRVIRYWYDATNRLRFTLNAESYLAEMRYEDSTREQKVIVYSEPVTIPDTATLQQIVQGGVSIPTGEPQLTTTRFDAAGRISSITDALLHTEYFGYDDVGNKTSYTNKKGSLHGDPAYTWTYVYDANGRLLEERTPPVSVTRITGTALLGSASDTVRIITRMTYDDLGNVRDKREGILLLADGVTEDAQGARLTTYGYDALGRQTTTLFPEVAYYNGSYIDDSSETPTLVERLSTEVTYDALGNATRNRDVGNGTSYKVYDSAGRVRYDIDALNYVTEHTYDDFGNELSMTRFAVGLTTLPTFANERILLEDMDAAVASLRGHASNRTIENSYDRLNRLVTVKQPPVYTYIPGADGATSSEFIESPTTYYEYNAFGNLIREWQLVDRQGPLVVDPRTSPTTNLWATTHYYYDRRGLQTGIVDAERYYTRMEYDETGDLKTRIEYANELTNFDATSDAEPNAPAAGVLGGAGRDRLYTYEYDVLNRKERETVSMQYAAYGSNGLGMVDGTKTTRFTYDQVGNQNSAIQVGVVVGNQMVDVTTYTYYDALGRIIGVAEPSRDPGDQTTLIPLTEMRRDAYGNLVEEIRYDAGAVSADVDDFAVDPSTMGNARHAFIVVNSHGWVTRTQDAELTNRYAAYDKRGNAVKEWQTLIDANNVPEVMVTLHEYDALRRRTLTHEPKVTGTVVRTQATYNAFGEIEAKWVHGDWEPEIFKYDNGGRLWFSNSGDGVRKVYAYNLAGQMTADVRSRSMVALDFNQSAQTSKNRSDTMRTENRYDLLGRLIEQRLPEFELQSSQDLLATQPSIGTRQMPTPPNAVYQGWEVPIEFGGGGIYYFFNPAPYSLGGGYYQVEPPSTQYPSGRYERVPEGDYSLDDATVFYWPPPAGLDVDADFEYWPLSNPSDIHTLDVMDLAAGDIGVNINSLPAGGYGYRISYRRTGAASAFATQEGTFDRGTSEVVRGTSTASESPRVRPTTTQIMDRWGNALSVTDAARQTIVYRYNELNQLTLTTAPTSNVVDTRNGITEGRRQTQTSNFYDLHGRLIETRDANDNVSRNVFNAAGQLIAHQNADHAAQTLTGSIKEFVYDTHGNVLQTTDELGFRTRNVYDKANRLIQVAREIQSGAFASDSPSDMAASNPAHVVLEYYDYDEADRRISETNGEGEVTRYFYDLHGNLIRRQTPRGFNTTYAYDVFGHKIQETDANGSDLTWRYDAFGQLQAHTELSNDDPNFTLLFGGVGGASYEYEYNEAGLLTSQVATRMWELWQAPEPTVRTVFNRNFTYDDAGHVLTIADDGLTNDFTLQDFDRLTTFRYDAAGRKARETVVVDGRTHQDTRIEYDELGRIAALDDPDYRLTYSYDAVGNRTVIQASYLDHQQARQSQNLYYSYDQMNRVEISQGYRTSSNTVAVDENHGTALTYNAKGERTSARTKGQRFEVERYLLLGQEEVGRSTRVDDTTPGNMATECYEYDGLGRLTNIYRESLVTNIFVVNPQETSGFILGEAPGREEIGVRVYDKASRLITEINRSLSGGHLFDRTTGTAYDDDGRSTVQTTHYNGQIESRVTFGDATSNDPFEGYDAAGLLRGYSVEVFQNGSLRYTTDYDNFYALGESYMETSQNAHSSGSNPPQSGSTYRSYNIANELVGFTDSRAEEEQRHRYFVNNAAGQVLTSIEGLFDTPQELADAWDATMTRSQLGGAYNVPKGQYFFFADGNYVGSFGQLQTSDGAFKANFDVNYTPVSNDYPASVPAEVIVQAGDTLRTIAARVFGDASLWYVIAEENGLTDPDAAITEGTTLRVPNEVVSLSNTANSFKPFDSSEALGDTTPTQPAPPAPRNKKGCGVLGMILIVVVAIVVTVFTAGVAAGGAGSAIWSTGVSALSGGAIGGATVGGLGAVGASIVGGAVGSAVSQGVAIAAGMQEGFDWKGVAMGAIGAGVTAGLGTVGFGGSVATRLGFAPNGFASLAVNAAASNALTQGIGVATGLQSSFNWRDVAVSAVAAPVANAVGTGVGNFLGSDFANKFASGVAGAAVRRAFGGKVDTASILADAFGNALGNSIVDGLAPKPALPSSTSEELGMRTMGKAMEGWLNSGSEGAVQWNDIGSLSSDGLAWESGVRTYPYIPPEEPTVMPLPEGPTVAGSNYNRHSLDDALIGGLKILNDKTQIAPLVNARNYLDHQLEGWADRTLQEGPSALTPLYGGLYAAGKAGVELFPTGAVDVVPELATFGKLARVGRAADSVSELRFLDDATDLARRELRTVSVETLDDFKRISRSPEASTVYKYDGFEFTTDAYGRGINSAGELSLGQGGNRFSTDRLLGYPHHPDALPGDIGFHAGADQFGFPGGKLNVFPGNAELNSAAGAYGKFEREVLRPLINDPSNKVYAEFNRIFYSGNASIRPDELQIIYRVNNGAPVTTTFFNKPGR